MSVNKISLLRKTVHILLAVLVFVSSSGLVFSKHYCRGELRKVAWFAPAKSCHDAAAKQVCPRHRAPASDSVAKNACCSTVTDFLKNDTDRLSTSEATLTEHPFAAAGLPDFVAFSVAGSQILSPVPYRHYKPPLLVRELTVSLQTFLC